MATPLAVSIPSRTLCGTIGAMLAVVRAMPIGVRVFLVYSLLLLSFLGLTLPLVVGEAVDAPISGIGLLWMLLLAYLIFTLTLTLQRKQAAYGLSLGLASLTVPLVPLLGWLAGGIGLAIALILAAAVLGSLLRPRTRTWFVEP
jgi:hypothetical protein